MKTHAYIELPDLDMSTVTLNKGSDTCNAWPDTVKHKMERETKLSQPNRKQPQRDYNLQRNTKQRQFLLSSKLKIWTKIIYKEPKHPQRDKKALQFYDGDTFSLSGKFSA